jgi:hypothetical protein
MDIKFKAAFDGKAYRVLIDGADTSIYKQVDEFEFVLKQSTILTVAAADSLVSAVTPLQPNGLRSLRAEERVFPSAYVKEHTTSIVKNGVEVKPITLDYVMSLGLGVLNHIHGTAEAIDGDFLTGTPPSSLKGGEKGTAETSKTSTTS